MDKFYKHLQCMDKRGFTLFILTKMFKNQTE